MLQEKAVAKRDEQIVAFETIRAHFVDYQEGGRIRGSAWLWLSRHVIKLPIYLSGFV